MKKGIIFSLLILTVGILLYFCNLQSIKNENNKLQGKVKTLRTENNELKVKFEDYKSKKTTKANNINRSNKDLVISSIQIKSDDIYKEGDLKGKIFGDFTIVVKVKNNSSSNVSQVKVSSLFLRTLPNYKTQVKVDSKMHTIEKLKMGEEKEVLFEGYHINHPEAIQEVIINISHKNYSSNIKKASIKSAFPPGSED